MNRANQNVSVALGGTRNGGTWHYPDSEKWGLRAPRKFFRPIEVDYWDGEE